MGELCGCFFVGPLIEVVTPLVYAGMTRRVAGVGAVLLALAGCDKTSKRCFEGEPEATVTLAACGELCERDKASDGCVRQVELANDACFSAGDAEVCGWMCRHATTGRDLYCAEDERLQDPQPR
ncbi:MAG: hypothetical protein AAF721_30290 [Myxococcota bacterium]